MVKAISWGVLGLLLGVGIFPLVWTMIFRVPVADGTSGVVGVVLGLVFFVAGLLREKSNKENSDEID